jgi:hypothetical protein
MGPTPRLREFGGYGASNDGGRGGTRPRRSDRDGGGSPQREPRSLPIEGFSPSPDTEVEWSSRFEPPDTDPYVRWCGRAAAVRPPPIPIRFERISCPDMFFRCRLLRRLTSPLSLRYDFGLVGEEIQSQGREFISRGKNKILYFTRSSEENSSLKSLRSRSGIPLRSPG